MLLYVPNTITMLSSQAIQIQNLNTKKFFMFSWHIIALLHTCIQRRINPNLSVYNIFFQFLGPFVEKLRVFSSKLTAKRSKPLVTSILLPSASLAVHHTLMVGFCGLQNKLRVSPALSDVSLADTDIVSHWGAVNQREWN